MFEEFLARRQFGFRGEEQSSSVAVHLLHHESSITSIGLKIIAANYRAKTDDSFKIRTTRRRQFDLISTGVAF